MKSDYYSSMLDLEGLDPELKGSISEWDNEEPQKVLLASLFSNNRLDVVSYLLNNDIFLDQFSEKLRHALEVKDLVFKSLRGVIKSEKEKMSPRALAEAELVICQPETKKDLAKFLAVEYPVRKDWTKRKVRHDDDRQVVDFYRKTDSYIWELMAANNIVETMYNYGVT